MTKSVTIDDIFKECIKKNASDVHLVVGRPPVFRIDGNLLLQDKFPVLDEALAKELVFSALSKGQQEKFNLEKEIDLSYDIENMGRFRINCYWERRNTAMAARLIPTSLPTMEELMLPQSVYSLSRLHQGLVLVTGPTGCGKSTTLASIINGLWPEAAFLLICFARRKEQNSLFAQYQRIFFARLFYALHSRSPRLPPERLQ